jgi:hypothetical protein
MPPDQLLGYSGSHKSLVQVELLLPDVFHRMQVTQEFTRLQALPPAQETPAQNVAHA